jgi:uncharacterized protein (TIGR02453 family)
MGMVVPYPNTELDAKTQRRKDKNAMGKKYFDRELFLFLVELKKNNNRNWFQANKARYEEHVKRPMLSFIEDFGPHLRRVHPRFVADPKPVGGSMFRIYRDIRFSEDKSPYKTQASAHFKHHKAGKDVHVPGFYLHLEPEKCFTASGIWHPDAPTLLAIRTAIVKRPDQWKKVRKKILIEGEKLSRPPKGFACDHPFIEDLKQKDFVTSSDLTEDQICSNEFMGELTVTYKKMLPLLEFLSTSLGLPW